MGYLPSPTYILAGLNLRTDSVEKKACEGYERGKEHSRYSRYSGTASVNVVTRSCAIEGKWERDNKGGNLEAEMWVTKVGRAEGRVVVVVVEVERGWGRCVSGRGIWAMTTRHFARLTICSASSVCRDLRYDDVQLIAPGQASKLHVRLHHCQCNIPSIPVSRDLLSLFLCRNYTLSD